jgi:hypothetical protein
LLGALVAAGGHTLNTTAALGDPQPGDTDSGRAASGGVNVHLQDYHMLHIWVVDGIEYLATFTRRCTRASWAPAPSST